MKIMENIWVIRDIDLGYDLSRHDSKSLAQIPDIEFDAAVTMGCGDACPNVKARYREDWPLPDPRNMDPDEFRKLRDLIRDHVSRLLERCA